MFLCVGVSLYTCDREREREITSINTARHYAYLKIGLPSVNQKSVPLLGSLILWLITSLDFFLSSWEFTISGGLRECLVRE